MVMWSKDHVMVIGVNNIESWKLLWNSLIGDRAGPLGGKWKTVGWERRRV
jgi:hypothetical protein